MMIPHDIIDKNAAYWYNYNSDLGDGFWQGVEFAEEYLKDVAVEFAEWILQNRNPGFNIQFGDNTPNKWGSVRIGKKALTTQELFQIFIKEKYESNSTD